MPWRNGVLIHPEIVRFAATPHHAYIAAAMSHIMDPRTCTDMVNGKWDVEIELGMQGSSLMNEVFTYESFPLALGEILVWQPRWKYFFDWAVASDWPLSVGSVSFPSIIDMY